MKLYSYWRSSASYRVRIALNLKGLPYEMESVHLVRDGGEQHTPAYSALNPQELVPTLVDGDAVLTQSLPIIEYLDERYGDVRLLPEDVLARARVRSLAQLVACEIHPLNNLSVLQYLARELELPEEQRNTWYRHWVTKGFAALEQMLAGSPETGCFCHGDTPTLADACLVPQVYNARRYNVDLSAFPTIQRIDANCAELDAFVDASPERQVDASA